ncbi:bifunctional folylpolyglutamate synthase/dihydrofolate synthase [Akkermansiaceae bacterium]|nr:bifunctional folylpolyglutamate synthase/dihydrofolate synthase [Akkermansiaceae bacterium]MDB4319931.1 bifunctional folylpolyglutamate synthase/dihydrofolate synthase [bacterium]MDB4334118.1 bifunctional folylpolyglutamate synthase/dihydrofolate synthase [Akkermansiaceae bacterium]MDB4597319.1 bifunctional folylpolyglutamate synthase/dihydrofolate synthase [Akkermansiaceae bacterium]MDB4716334.1 bifunctional folylpolyglutamate synthase/dihydrofolate synthase [bacterium]
MNYQEAIDWLYSTQMFGIKLGLDAPKRLLRDFLAFPKHSTQVIHVAGTNGKGSTCAMIDSLGRSLALRTGLFTSPHLIDYCERIRVSGGEIPHERAAELLTELRELVKDWETHPTFFELTLALAMRHFREMNCDLVILETGMGGRLDATTAVPADVCALTPIALDHTKWLGSTLTEIAFEKASIALYEKPLISAQQEPEAQIEIERVANQVQAPLFFIDTPLLGYHIALAGEHQKLNAALACETMIAAGYQLSYDVVQHAFSTLRWPGRFEVYERTPFNHKGHLILDAAHNPHSAKALIETWKSVYSEAKAQVIFGSVEDKESATVLKIISEITEHFHFVPVNSPRGIAPEALIEMIGDASHTVHDSVNNALTTSATQSTHTLLTGSLFLLGESKGIIDQRSTRKSTQ